MRRLAIPRASMPLVRTRPGAEAAPKARPAPARRRLPFTAVILTLNECERIARCVDSVIGLADEVLVVDSGSTDGTQAIAEGCGARVAALPWQGGFGKHRNAAMTLAEHDWCLHLDADEIVGRDLARAVLEALSDDPDPRQGFAVIRQFEFCAVPIPSRPRPGRRLDLVRLLNRRHTRFDNGFHEGVVCEGPRVLLAGRLFHWRNFTLAERFAQNNKLSSGEAREKHERGRESHPVRLLFLPMLRFLWHYFLDGSWRVGTPGLVHALTRASEEFMREAKLWELGRGPVSLPPVDTYRSGE